MMEDAEIMERAIKDFQKVQAHMEVAKRENAVKTYSSLKNTFLLRHYLQV